MENKKNNFNKDNGIKNDFILKEAELIINNYIKDNRGKFTSPKRKQEFIKDSKFIKNLIINSALLGSLVAVTFLLIKLF